MIKISNFKFQMSLLLLAACCLPYSSARADERVITLQDAWQLAISGYESVRLSEEDLYQAEKGINKALSQMLPTVTADGNYTKYTESKTVSGFGIQPDFGTTYNLKIAQPVFSGGKDWSLWRQAKKKVEGSRYGFEGTKENIALDASRAYYNVLKGAKNVEIKEAALKRAKERSKVANSRFRVGDVTKAVALRADADTAGAEAELANAKKDLLVGQDKLKRIIAVSEDFKLADPNIQPIPDGGIEKLVSISLEKRRDYIQSKIDEEVADEGISYAAGNFLPSLKLEAVYSRRDQEPKTAFFIQETVYGGVTLTYPLFEGGLRKAELDEAKSKRRQAEFKRVGLRKDIEVDVREAFHNLEALNSTIESYKKQLSFAEENYTMVFKQFSYGLATNVDVIDADATLVSSQRNLANARYDYQVAILDLKKKVGTLLDDVMSGK